MFSRTVLVYHYRPSTCGDRRDVSSAHSSESHTSPPRIHCGAGNRGRSESRIHLDIDLQCMTSLCAKVPIYIQFTMILIIRWSTIAYERSR